MAAKKPMSENARKVLAYLQNAGVGVKFTAKQVQEDLGFDKPGYVTGSVTSLVNKECAERFTETITNEAGKTVEVKKFALTEKGATYDPDAAFAEANAE